MELVELLKNPVILLMALPTLLVALNELLKSIGLDSKYCPVVNLIGGFLAFPFLTALGLTWYVAVIGSLMLGLSASGFYDLGNKTMKNN